MAEKFTGFFQGFDDALSKGRPSDGFMEGKELGQHGEAVGKYMGFLPAGGVAVTNTRASLTRMFGVRVSSRSCKSWQQCLIRR